MLNLKTTVVLENILGITLTTGTLAAGAVVDIAADIVVDAVVDTIKY